MLPFPQFSLEAPDRIEDAVALLSAPGAQLLAGGTDLLPSVKHRLFTPKVLVSTRRLAVLRDVAETDGGVSIGAGLTLRQVARDPRVASRYPGLVAACRTVGTTTIQAMATIGGNVMLDTRCLFYNQPAGWRAALGYCLKKDGTVCHVAPKGKGCYAAHSADTVPTLWLLGARLEVTGPKGTREILLSALYRDDGMRWHGIAPDEILVRIHLPAPAALTVHRKLRTRQAIDYSLLLVAATRGPEGYRAVVSGTGPTPVAVTGADPVALAEAAYGAVQPLSTHQPPAAWRKKMVRVEVRRAAESLASAPG